MADETAKAQTAQAGGDTIFGKITRKEIDVNFLHEDDKVCISHLFWLEFTQADVIAHYRRCYAKLR